jgi:hypothetical protein
MSTVLTTLLWLVVGGILYRLVQRDARNEAIREVKTEVLKQLEDRVNELHAANGGDNDESRMTAQLYHQLRTRWLAK